MSRRLVVLRHAKSAYPPGVADHDRPLAPRGVVDAKAAGAWIHHHVGRLDHVVVSSARRARGTWTLAAGVIGYIGAAGYDVDSPGPLTVDPRVYDASIATLLEVLGELPDRVGTALLVGHNPGCEDLVDTLAGDADPAAARLLAVKYPTCGTAVLDLDVAWCDLAPGVARLSAFVVPRGTLPG
jgi:phosphohistidine phosphatase